MNRNVNAISSRLSLRSPQRASLEILHRVTELVNIRETGDVQQALASIAAEYPSVKDFEREFPSLCFALATGVGKTRLMGAFISYLHLEHGINHFFVLAPNLTIYNKLIADFTPNTPKYVFKGISEFATDAPEIITGDNYEAKAGTLFDLTLRCKINIFNISKINSEVRGGNAPRIKRLSEYIGQSYFEYLAGLPDLVLLMDESHRYRASAGVRAINELKPILGLELTATPMIETAKGATPFKNVIIDYALGRAMADGFVKEPAVVTRKDFNPSGMAPEQIERLKLEDGVRLHEQVKVELETYARETNNRIVKPFVLVIARDTTHASQLLALIQSPAFFEGRYKDKVIQVDSSKSGKEEEEMIQRLLDVEKNEEPTEIVIHVNMLKEGWDVTNLYTIVPLRAANARILIEQSIGRGLRLPYGKRTGVTSVDRLNIVAHDKFQEIIDDANKPDSQIRMQTVVLAADGSVEKLVTVVAQSRLATQLGLQPEQVGADTVVPKAEEKAVFTTPEEQRAAQVVYKVIRKLESDPSQVPSVETLLSPAVQKHIIREAEAAYLPKQGELEGVVQKPDFAAIAQKTAELVARETISIPKISVQPVGEVKSGFKPFKLELGSLKLAPVSEELWVQHLRTHEREIISVGRGGLEEERLEDYVVSGLVDFDDISYDHHAELLYELAGQAVSHFRSYLGEDKEVGKVLRCHQREIARFIHVQMQKQHWEEAAGYETVVRGGFSELRTSSYTAAAKDTILDCHQGPPTASKIGQYVFSGYKRLLQEVVKFQSDTERRLSLIIDRDSLRWFRPAKGQFQIYYKWAGEHPEYQPDFVAETVDAIYMIESKAKNELESPEVLAKKEAAEKWCVLATDFSAQHGGKPWKYLLIPHDAVATNMTLDSFVKNCATT